jgi:site-specific recombinase XerD
MIEDMRIRNLSPRTISAYVRQVASFAAYFGRSPVLLGPEEIRSYQRHLVYERELSESTLTQAVCALRFLYHVTLGKDWPIRFIPYPKRERTRPVPGADPARRRGRQMGLPGGRPRPTTGRNDSASPR